MLPKRLQERTRCRMPSAAGRVAAALIVAACVMLLFSVATAYAQQDPRWYAAKIRERGYGLQADISTPAAKPGMAPEDPGQPPNLNGSMVFHWVSTTQARWVQTGWGLADEWPKAKSYYEYFDVDGTFHQIWLSVQEWNFTRTYKLEYYTGDNRWHVFIGAGQKGNGFVVSGQIPQEIKVASESTNQLNVFNTPFNNVKYKGTTTWFLFETNGGWDPATVWYEEDNPYAITKVYPYHWNSLIL